MLILTNHKTHHALLTEFTSKVKFLTGSGINTGADLSFSLVCMNCLKNICKKTGKKCIWKIIKIEASL